MEPIISDVQAAAFALMKDAEARLTAAGSDSPRLDAEILLAEALKVERNRFYINDDLALDGSAVEKFRALVARRAAGEPVAYILGRREFWSLDFIVTAAVLTPRPETELLVETVLKLLAGKLSPRILDVGTGSGAVAVSLAKEIPGAEIVATDISIDALEVARANARRHGVQERVALRAGDLFNAAGGMKFDMIVSNPPYIREADIAALPRDVRGFEPLIALDGGADGLDYYRRIASEAPEHLNTGGVVAVEIGAGMGAEVARLFAEAGLADVRIERDLAGLDRVVSARRPARG